MGHPSPGLRRPVGQSRPTYEPHRRSPPMSRRPRASHSSPQHYAPDIEHLQLQLTALGLHWQGVAPMPPSTAEVMEELTSAVEGLQMMNDELTASQQAATEGQRRYQELFDGVPDTYLITDLQGFISNSLQHAFPGDRAGAITMTPQAEPPGQVTLSRRDTGVGAPLDVEAHDTEGLGFRLIHTLTEQLQGTLVITHNQGTYVTLRFPV